MVGALNQERSEVDVSSLGNTKLRVAVPGLAASRPQAEVTAHIATSLETFFASQSQHIRQRSELADAVDLKQRLRLRLLCEIARSSRTLATITSCPISSRCSLTQIEWVPVSIATRALGTSVNHFPTPEGVVRNRPRSTTSPSSLSVQ